MKMRKISWVIVAIVSLVICGGVMAVTIPTLTIANTADVHTPAANIKAYWDEECTQPLNTIEWGHIDEGIEHSKTFWIKNEGDDAVCAEWQDDIEEARSLRYDDSDMEYYNETTQRWRYWSEEWEYIIPVYQESTPTPTPTPTPMPYRRGGAAAPRDSDNDGVSDVDEMLAGTDPEDPTDTPIYIVSQPLIEPGEKVKVRYIIEFEISPIREVTIPPVAVGCGWNLTLGY